MIKKIYSEENKSIVYAHKLMGEDYQILSETFQIPEEKIKNITNEEIFTPRISKSDWEIYKLYYPKIESNNKDEKYFWCEISPLVILKKEEKLTIIDENYFDEFHNFVEEYTKINSEIEINKFLITMLHKVSQSLYKYVRFLIGEHDQIETILREQQSNEKLISLAEVEQGFYIYNIALRNLSFVIENLNEEPEFEKYDEYMVRILQEINFTTDLSSSYCEICKTTRETYSSYIGNNMNITMKFLAAATILITVPNMIFGFYGMNILLPFQNKGFATLAIITVIMIALMVILWKYMKKKIL
jgi:mg2+ and co2+ transporter-like protein